MAKALAQQTVNQAGRVHIERRTSERAELVVRVDYETVDQLFSEFARNINESGLFVETETPPELGSLVSLHFKIPGGDEPIQVQGRVVRDSDGSGDEPPGMGIEFDDLEAHDRERINDLVRRLRTDAPRS